MRSIINISKILLVVLLLAGAALFAMVIPTIYFNPQDQSITFTNQVPQQNTVISKVAYISGAVSKPAVYQVNSDTRIIDLIEMAGGFLPEADSEYVNNKLNLAKLVEDEEHITIPYKGVAGASTTSNSGLININTATAAQLMDLPGVGESTANKIIQGRPYSSLEQLLDVPGIGDSKYAQLKSSITL